METNRLLMKMNGAGNRIVILDLIDRLDHTTVSLNQINTINKQYAFDQLMVIHGSEKDKTDAFVRIFNCDGSEAEACGNGMRCVAHVLMTKYPKIGDKIIVDTIVGERKCWRLSQHQYTVDMGLPKLHWHQIPIDRPIDTASIDIEQLISIDEWIVDTKLIATLPSALNTGNPHLIFFVDYIDRFDIETIGPFFETCRLFPNRANVSIVEIVSEREIRQKVWERGAGRTLACGTAACAAVVAGVRRRMTKRIVQVHMPGGDLHIEWRKSDNRAYLTGHVVEEIETLIRI